MGIHFFTFWSLSLLISIFLSPLSNAQRSSTFEVGVILDNDTLVGDIGITSLSLALSDFYSSNPNYSTRLVLHTRDSGGQVTGAAATGIYLSIHSIPLSTSNHFYSNRLVQQIHAQILPSLMN